MSESHFDHSQTYFAAIAESYDRLQPIVVGPSYERGLAFVVDLVPRAGDEAFTFVELGCGTAELTLRVLGRFSRARAVAIDSEPAMLDIARAKLSPCADRAEVREADVLSCGIPSCDVVLSAFMFHHVPPDSLEDTLSRIARALTRAGCLILLDQMQAGPRWGECVGAHNRRLHQQHVAAAITTGQATQDEIDARWALKRKMKAEGKDVEHRHTAEGILEAMRATGFTEVGLVWRMFASTILMGFVPSERR